MNRIALAFIVLQIVLVGLMPPGLCSCWLLPNVDELHVHITTSESGHSHDYLGQSFPAGGNFFARDVRPAYRIDPGAAFLEGILSILFEHVFFGRMAVVSPPIPPPEL